MYERDRSFVLDRSNVTINGSPLSEYGAFLTDDGYDIGEAQPATATQDIPGAFPVDVTLRDGTGRAAFSRRTITLNIAVVGDRDEVTEGMRAIGRLSGLEGTIGGLVDLGEFRGMLAVGQWALVHDWAGELKAAVTEVTMDAEPYVYGAKRREYILHSDDPVRIDGDVPVYVRFDLGGRDLTMCLKCVEWLRMKSGTFDTKCGNTDNLTIARAFLNGDTSVAVVDWATENPEWGNDLPKTEKGPWTLLTKESFFTYDDKSGYYSVSVGLDPPATAGISMKFDTPVNSFITMVVDTRNRQAYTDGKNNLKDANLKLDEDWMMAAPGRYFAYNNVNAPMVITYTPLYLV